MKRLTRWALVRGGPPAMQGLARTWRMELVHRERWLHLRASGEAFVLLAWHDALLPVLWQHRHLGIAAVVSAARDGQYLAALARRLGYEVIAGSSTRGGVRALRGAIRALQAGAPVGLTPDGPRGPRRTVKPGVVVAAAQSGALILPVHAEARPAWRARSWDRFLVPPPFARVRLAYGEPFRVSGGAGGRPAAVAQVARELDAVTRVAAWPEGAAIPTG